jgi:hypothetical protein
MPIPVGHDGVNDRCREPRVQVQISIDDRVRREGGQGPRARGDAESLAQGGIAHEDREGGGHLAPVLATHDEPVLPVADPVGGEAHRGRDHGEPGGHRLGHRVGEALRPRRHGEHVGGTVKAIHVELGAHEAHALTMARFAGPRGDARRFGADADDHEDGVAPLGDLVPGLHQHVEALLR